MNYTRTLYHSKWYHVHQLFANEDDWEDQEDIGQMYPVKDAQTFRFVRNMSPQEFLDDVIYCFDITDIVFLRELICGFGRLTAYTENALSKEEYYSSLFLVMLTSEHAEMHYFARDLLEESTINSQDHLRKDSSKELFQIFYAHEFMKPILPSEVSQVVDCLKTTIDRCETHHLKRTFENFSMFKHILPFNPINYVNLSMIYKFYGRSLDLYRFNYNLGYNNLHTRFNLYITFYTLENLSIDLKGLSEFDVDNCMEQFHGLSVIFGFYYMNNTNRNWYKRYLNTLQKSTKTKEFIPYLCPLLVFAYSSKMKDFYEFIIDQLTEVELFDTFKRQLRHCLKSYQDGMACFVEMATGIFHFFVDKLLSKNLVAEELIMVTLKEYNFMNFVRTVIENDNLARVMSADCDKNREIFEKLVSDFKRIIQRLGPECQ